MIDQYSSCIDDYPYVMDLQHDIYYISKKAVERFHIPTSKFNNVLEVHRQFVHEDDFPHLIEDLKRMISGEKESHNLQYRWLDKDGYPIWIDCKGQVIRDENGKPRFMLGCVNEIGRMAKADNVSGLLQSTAMKQYLDQTYREEPNGFILRIGVDGFNDINEKFGMEYGNHVLRGVASCIIDSLQPGEEAYHVVADEYIILDCNGSSEKEAHELYRNIRRKLDLFIEENNYEAVYTISGGILSTKEVEHPDYGEIMKLSQFALSQAKLEGKNQVYIFKQEDYELFLRKRNILRELRKSVADDFRGFDLYFQPIMTAGDADDAKLFAAESLLRFKTSEGEFLSPIEFIPILEESCLIVPVGKWILDKAASMCKEVRNFYPDFKVSVNLSYVQILKSAILNEVFNVIARYALTPDSMIMEMTESGYLEDTPSVRRVWNSLKKFGVLIAIDDFGTGYSNIQSISKLTPDIVKLDRGFTVKALKNNFENQLMSHVIELVHSIDLKICVEGVETKEELTRLNDMDPNFIQGYFYSKPCPREAFLKMFVAEA